MVKDLGGATDYCGSTTLSVELEDGDAVPDFIVYDSSTGILTIEPTSLAQIG